MAEEFQEDPDVMAAFNEVVDKASPPQVKKKPKAKTQDEETVRWIVQQVDESISDGYIYSGSERQTQQAEAWRRYYREPYGNEVDGYSEYVSPILQMQVDQAVAFISDKFSRNSSPIIKFRPSRPEDGEEAELATEWLNHQFREKLDGHSIIRQTVFNAALLKMCPVRVYMKEVRSQEPIIFKFEGPEEKMVDRLANFMVANDVTEAEPYEIIEDGDYWCYKWEGEEIVERYPDIEVISPENFFVSRQAESLEDAKVVSKITNMYLGDIKEMYPEAPELNGFKSKKDQDKFWEELQGDYQTWYSESTWFAKWANDSLQYFEQYDNNNDDSSGLGTKQLFVVDAEIYINPDYPKDTGRKVLCHVVKAGNYILHKQEISERSFVCGSLFPVANKWVGLGLWDKSQHEMREETTLTRAFTDSAAGAAHPNISFDPNVYEEDDIYNRGPDSVFRVKIGALPQPGIPPLEVIAIPGPDPSVQAGVQHFKVQATEITGVGAGFQGATSEDVSDMRLDKDTAKAYASISDLQLNDMSRNYAAFLCRVLVKLLNTGIKGGGSPKLLKIQDAWEEVDPGGLKPRSDFILNADIGVNDTAENLNAVAGIISAIGILTGQPDPATGQTLGVQAELLPTAGYEIGKKMLEAHGALDLVDKIFLRPDVTQDPQVTAAIQKAVGEVTAQFQQQMAQMQEQITEQVKMELNTAEKQAQIQLDNRKIELEERKQDHAEDKDAFSAATDDVAEERREEAEVYKAAHGEKDLEIKDKKVEYEHERNLRELESQERIANKAAEAKATAVVSPS